MVQLLIAPRESRGESAGGQLLLIRSHTGMMRLTSVSAPLTRLRLASTSLCGASSSCRCPTRASRLLCVTVLLTLRVSTDGSSGSQALQRLDLRLRSRTYLEIVLDNVPSIQICLLCHLLVGLMSILLLAQCLQTLLAAHLRGGHCPALPRHLSRLLRLRRIET